MIVCMIYYYPIFVVLGIKGEKLKKKNLFRIIFSLPYPYTNVRRFECPYVVGK